MPRKRVLMTGATGYIASLLLPAFRERYDLVLIDAKAEDRDGRPVEGVAVADLIDPDRTKYEAHFQGVDALVHLAWKPRSGAPIEHFGTEKQNVEMAYNVLRTAYEANVPRAVVASSNHAADWYEHNQVHARALDVVDPYALPLSDNFYGWAKATYEHIGFLFACGFPVVRDDSGAEWLLGAEPSGPRMGVVMVRIGHPQELHPDNYANDPQVFKRVLGAYVSTRDLSQLMIKSIETPNIDNENGIPWHVVYGISDNTRAFWSLANARRVLGYTPEDDSEIKFAHHVDGLITGESATGGVGRVGLS